MTFREYVQVFLVTVAGISVALLWTAVVVTAIMRSCIEYWFAQKEAYEKRIMGLFPEREFAKHLN